jgi:hypothetical protein
VPPCSWGTVGSASCLGLVGIIYGLHHIENRKQALFVMVNGQTYTQSVCVGITDIKQKLVMVTKHLYDTANSAITNKNKKGMCTEEETGRG